LSFHAGSTAVLLARFTADLSPSPGRDPPANRYARARCALADRCAAVDHYAVADHYAAVDRYAVVVHTAVADRCAAVDRCAAAVHTAAVDRYAAAVRIVEANHCAPEPVAGHVVRAFPHFLKVQALRELVPAPVPARLLPVASELPSDIFVLCAPGVHWDPECYSGRCHRRADRLAVQLRVCGPAA